MQLSVIGSDTCMQSGEDRLVYAGQLRWIHTQQETQSSNGSRLYTHCSISRSKFTPSFLYTVVILVD